MTAAPLPTICLGLALAGAGAARPAVPDRPASRPPNIVFIHADDLGYGELGAYGQRRFRTPHLDRLASEGLRFTQYYAGSTVCAPSRAALMTGRHTGHAWVRGNGDIPLRGEDVTIAEVLRPRGYRTAVVGKWGLGDADTSGRPDRQGFDEAFGFLRHPHAHRQSVDRLWKNDRWIDVSPDAYVGDLFTAAAIDFVERAQDQPFFLYLAYTVPHAELRPPAEAMAPFLRAFPEQAFVNEAADRRQPVPPYDRSAGYRSQPTPHAAHAAAIARLDRDVGRLRERLEALHLDRHTLVLFTSDNGPHKEGGADPEFFDSNGALRGIKRDLYEGGIRVPMVAWWPGRVPAGVRETVWTHWDVLPTLADLAGATVPPDLDGVSQEPVLMGGMPPAPDRFLYWEFHERGFEQASRWRDWKAVRHGPDRPLELYDIARDRGERTDVAARHPEIVERFERFLSGARTPSERWPGQEGPARRTAPADPAPPTSPPTRNVLLLIADDHGRDSLGAYGNRVVKTPHLDRLAAEGVRFTQAWATTASCSPSRSVLLTGLHTHTSGQYGLAHARHNQHTFDGVRSLPTLLRGTHRTGIIGKEHVKPESVYPFDVRVSAGLQGNRDVAAMARHAAEFFTAADARPFFLVLGYSDPHRAGNPQNGWRGFANDPSYPGVERVTYAPADVIVPAHLPDAPEVREELSEYYQSVSRLDQGVGLVLRALAQSGHADDTLVLYLSDNGIPFPGAKTTLYAPGVHLPLLVRAPGRGRPGSANHAMVSWVDIAPTILDWTGTAAPDALTGRSLLPILDQEHPRGWDEVYGSHQMHEITMYYPMRSVRTRTHALLWNLAHALSFPHASDLFHSPTWQGVLRRGDGRLGRRTVESYLHRPEFELYDVVSDPHELDNLASRPDQRGILVDLQARLRRMLERTEDPWLVESVR